MTANIFEALNESVVLTSWRECCCLKIWTWKKLPWSSATTQAATNKCDAARALCSSTVTLPRHLFPLVPFLFGASSSRCTSSCCYVHSRVPPTLIPITCDSRVSLKLGYLVVARGHTLHLASGLNLTGECVSSSPTTHIWPGFNIQLCCFLCECASSYSHSLWWVTGLIPCHHRSLHVAFLQIRISCQSYNFFWWAAFFLSCLIFTNFHSVDCQLSYQLYCRGVY